MVYLYPTSLMYGCLTIAGTTPLQEFPDFENPNTVRGFHAPHPYKGSYALMIDGDFEELEIPLPTRNKYLTVTVVTTQRDNSLKLVDSLTSSLLDIDSRFEGSRHLFKMNMLMKEIGADFPYTVCVNNDSTHSYFTLLTQDNPLYVYGIYDTVNKSVRLVWAHDESFIYRTKKKDPTRYVVYRYPILNDRPMFIHSLAICSKWSEWIKNFTQPDGVLRAFNALENFLYKDPNLANLTVQS